MGTLIGAMHVRRSIWIDADPSLVWEEVESMHRLSAWFSQGHQLEVFEPGEDGRLELSVAVDGETRTFGGRIVVWAPQRELTFTDNWDPPHQWPVDTFVTLRLTPLYEGTQVELFHHGFERLGASAGKELEGYEAGWTVRHLKTLKQIVEA